MVANTFGQTASIFEVWKYIVKSQLEMGQVLAKLETFLPRRKYDFVKYSFEGDNKHQSYQLANVSSK